MKNRLLLSVMISVLAVSGSLFARYCDQRRADKSMSDEGTIQVMSYVSAEEKQQAGVTFSDLAAKIDVLANGGENS